MAPLPTSALFGYATLLGAAGLVASTALLSIAWRSVALLIVSALVDLLVVCALAYHIMRVGHLVFGTRGRGHHALTAWRLVDVLLSNILLHTAFLSLVWRLAAACGASTDALFTHPFEGAWHALYETLLYTSTLYTGGGIVDVAPEHEALRAATAIGGWWQIVTLGIVLAAATAALLEHTDGDAEKAASPPRLNVERAHEWLRL